MPNGNKDAFINEWLHGVQHPSGSDTSSASSHSSHNSQSSQGSSFSSFSSVQTHASMSGTPGSVPTPPGSSYDSVNTTGTVIVHHGAPQGPPPQWMAFGPPSDSESGSNTGSENYFAAGSHPSTNGSRSRASAVHIDQISDTESDITSRRSH